VCINMFTLVNDLWAAQFVTINVDGTVTSNDTCVVISRPSRTVGSSRFQNFYVSQLYRAYVTTCCHVGSVELWNVHYSRYIDTLIHWYNCLLKLISLVTSHVDFNLSIGEVTFDLAWLWNVRGRFALARSTPYLHYLSSSCSSILWYGLQHISTKSIARSYTLVVQK